MKVAKYAARSNIKNIFSTTGVITEEAVKTLAKHFDAVVVHLKASLDPNYMSNYGLVKTPNPIFETLEQIKKQRIHLEITNTIIPQIGDSLEKCKKLAEYITAEISPIVPFHVLQFHPNDRFADLPFTPINTLEQCADEVRRSGLRYVYVGNLIEPHRDESTFCYNCRELLIERVSGMLKKNVMQKDRCPNCGVRIDVVV
jgi:pyruvate formate lyase activating enzyme